MCMGEGFSTLGNNEDDDDGDDDLFLNSQHQYLVVSSCTEYDTVSQNVHLGLCPASLSTTL